MGTALPGDDPAAPLVATATPRPETLGAARTAAANVTASAAVARQDATAPRSDLSAAVGASQFDTGPPSPAATLNPIVGVGQNTPWIDTLASPTDLAPDDAAAPISSAVASDVAPRTETTATGDDGPIGPVGPAMAASGRLDPSTPPTRIAAATLEGPTGLNRLALPSDPLITSPLGVGPTPEDHRVPLGRLPTPILGGVTATIRGAATQPAAAFADRGRRQAELQSGGADEATARTEAAIELGLQFLARQQQADGRWSFQIVRGDPASATASLRGDVAATGLALLSFLGAGYNHLDDRYRDTIARGLEYLIRSQQPDGGLYLASEVQANHVVMAYGHAIAAMALCEAVGMTGDPTLSGPAQRALDFTIAAQYEPTGGWRYVPGSVPDLSVTGWQWMALKSGQLAGLTVDPRAMRRTTTFIERSRGPGQQSALFVYNPTAPDTPQQRHGRQPSTVMTAVGMLLEIYAGADRKSASLRAGADHLLANPPTIVGEAAAIGTVGNPQRDTYYWYYGTQVMFQMGGRYWESWNAKLHPLLIDSQMNGGALSGSWTPLGPVPDRWGAHGGRLYVTSLNLLSLEVYYRHLPVYAEVGE